jgi:hypothetical protein
MSPPQAGKLSQIGRENGARAQFLDQQRLFEGTY